MNAFVKHILSLIECPPRDYQNMSATAIVEEQLSQLSRANVTMPGHMAAELRKAARKEDARRRREEKKVRGKRGGERSGR